jgi:hypothetical protein
MEEVSTKHIGDNHNIKPLNHVKVKIEGILKDLNFNGGLPSRDELM